MNCTNCGAPLPAKSNICTFCSTLNDVDLRNIPVTRSAPNLGDRTCPRCKMTLQAMAVGAGIDVQIDRCPECHGIFFDPGELEVLLDAVGRVPDQADLQRLNALIDEELSDAATSVQYAPCPICHELMHRRAFGEKAGVVIDTCRDHGVWLDGGELGQLRKWVRAGGREYARKRKEEKLRTVEREAKRRKASAPIGDSSADGPTFSNDPLGGSVLVAVLHLVARLLR